MATLHLILRVSSEEQAQDGEKGFDVQLDSIVGFTDSISKYDGYERAVYPFTQSSTEPKFLEDRPDLRQILDVVKPDDVPCYFNMERLSREGFVRSEFIQHLIHRKKVTELIVSDKIYDLTNQSDLMLLGVYSSVTHKQTQEDVMRRVMAKRKHKDEGKYTGHMLALGYTVIKGKDKHMHYIIDEKTSKVYNRIVDLYLEGKSTSKIAEFLNAEGIPTPRTGQKFKRERPLIWQSGTISCILRNKFYLGKVINGQQVIPALITQEQWDKVQEALCNRITRPGPKNPQKVFLLRDALYCGRCGNRVLGREVIAKRKRKPVYRLRQYHCSHRWLEREFRGRREQCNLPLIDMDLLDGGIWDRIVELVQDTDTLKAAVKWSLTTEAKDEDLEKYFLGKQAEIKKYERAISSLLDYASLGHWTSAQVNSKVKEYKGQIDRLKYESSLLQDKLSRGQKLDNTLQVFNKIMRAYKDMDNFTDQEKYDFLKDMVDKIVIDEVDNKLTYELEGTIEVFEWMDALRELAYGEDIEEIHTHAPKEYLLLCLI